MSTPSQPDFQNQPSTVEEIIREIEKRVVAGDYIYRGERECYEKVSSSLYREYADIEAEHFDIEVVEREMLSVARKHAGHPLQDFLADFAMALKLGGTSLSEIDDFEILTELQHYGGKTNLIDFTTDYLIALFFACDGQPDKDGRVILQKIGKIKDMIKPPRNPRHRVIAQKSVFVRPPKGFIEPAEGDIVIIRAALKQPMLAHLRKYHGVSTETIYNDIHGFIRTRDIHRSAYSEFYRGLTCQESVTEASPLEERQAAYAKAVAHYTEALTFKPDMAEAYNNRGTVYNSQDMFNLAISDYTAAIELELDFHVAYYNRGVAYFLKSDYDSAIENFNETIRVNPDFPDAYYTRAAAYLFNGELNLAIADYTKVIELDSGDTDAYYSRGIARLQLQEWREAEADLTAARNEGMDIIAAFHKDYESIATFEGKFHVKLPEDITAMLRQS